MKTTDSGWYQVVIDPETPNAEALLAAAQLVADADPTPNKQSFWLDMKEWASKVLHPFGVHHFVPMKRWDAGSQRIIHTDIVVCMWCTRAQRED